MPKSTKATPTRMSGTATTSTGHCSSKSPFGLYFNTNTVEAKTKTSTPSGIMPNHFKLAVSFTNGFKKSFIGTANRGAHS